MGAKQHGAKPRPGSDPTTGEEQYHTTADRRGCGRLQGAVRKEGEKTAMPDRSVHAAAVLYFRKTTQTSCEMLYCPGRQDEHYRLEQRLEMDEKRAKRLAKRMANDVREWIAKKSLAEKIDHQTLPLRQNSESDKM